ISKLDAGHKNLAAVGVYRAWGSAPLALDVVHIRTKPSILVHAHSISDVRQHAELSRIAFEQHLTQVLRTIRHIDRVAVRSQPGKYLPEAWKNIEISGSPDVPFVRRKAKHKKREAQFLPRRNTQAVPSSEP